MKELLNILRSIMTFKNYKIGRYRSGFHVRSDQFSRLFYDNYKAVNYILMEHGWKLARYEFFWNSDLIIQSHDSKKVGNVLPTRMLFDLKEETIKKRATRIINSKSTKYSISGYTKVENVSKDEYAILDKCVNLFNDIGEFKIKSSVKHGYLEFHVMKNLTPVKKVQSNRENVFIKFFREVKLLVFYIYRSTK